MIENIITFLNNAPFGSLGIGFGISLLLVFKCVGSAEDE